jgi:hypothetical protein
MIALKQKIAQVVIGQCNKSSGCVKSVPCGPKTSASAIGDEDSPFWTASRHSQNQHPLIVNRSGPSQLIANAGACRFSGDLHALKVSQNTQVSTGLLMMVMLGSHISSQNCT